MQQECLTLDRIDPWQGEPINEDARVRVGGEALDQERADAGIVVDVARAATTTRARPEQPGRLRRPPGGAARASLAGSSFGIVDALGEHCVQRSSTGSERPMLTSSRKRMRNAPWLDSTSHSRRVSLVVSRALSTSARASAAADCDCRVAIAVAADLAQGCDQKRVGRAEQRQPLRQGAAVLGEQSFGQCRGDGAPARGGGRLDRRQRAGDAEPRRRLGGFVVKHLVELALFASARVSGQGGADHRQLVGLGGQEPLEQESGAFGRRPVAKEQDPGDLAVVRREVDGSFSIFSSNGRRMVA